jgi:integrase/recombinase XerC
VLRITGKGGKTRLVPTLPAAREAVAAYVRLPL